MDIRIYVTIIAVSILMMLTLFADVSYNSVLSRKNLNFYRITFVMIALGAALECAGTLMNGNPGNMRMHSLIKLAEFSITPLAAIFMAKSINISDKKGFGAMVIVAAVHAVFEFAANFFKLVFSIGADGIYHREHYYVIYIAVYGLAMVYMLVSIISVQRKLRSRGLFTVVLVLLTVMAGLVPSIIDSKIRTAYLAFAVGATLSYIYSQSLTRWSLELRVGFETDLAHRDVLTGVSNRLLFEQDLERLDYERCNSPEDFSFVVCMCDVNKLKEVNDKNGHSAGDEYLKRCCRALCDFFPHSRVYRIGGDEFAVIMQNEDLGSWEATRSTLRSFSKTNYVNEKNIGDESSLAAGFAQFDPVLDATVDDTVKRADADMYENKLFIESQRKD